MVAIKTLKEYRKDTGRTQVYVAEVLKITRNTLANKENGKTKFNADELQVLAKLYDIKDIQDIKLK